MNFPQEAVAMLKEMGLTGEQILKQNSLSLFEVVKAILSGQLRVNRLPRV
jgi:hypothetical protein